MPQTNQDFTKPPRLLKPNAYGPKRFNWQFPDGDYPPAPKTLTLTGSGFGANGPNVVLFDRFSGGKSGDLIPATRSGDVGAWKKIAWSQPRLYQSNGRSWMAARDTSNLAATTANVAGLMFYMNSYFTEFRYSHRAFIPNGFNFPGADAPNIFPGNSTWKQCWFADIDESNNFLGSDEQDHTIHDLCIPTHVGSGAMQIDGNTTHPRYYDVDINLGNAFYMSFTHGQENMYCHYQSGAESSAGAHDQRVDGTWFRGSTAVGLYSRLQSNPFRVTNGTQANVGYRSFRTTGWFGSAASFANVLPLYGDVYLAVGPNARACVYVTDSPVFANSTKGYLLPAFSWSNGLITTNIAGYEQLGFYHVQPSVGPMIENVVGVLS